MNVWYCMSFAPLHASMEISYTTLRGLTDLQAFEDNAIEVVRLWANMLMVSLCVCDLWWNECIYGIFYTVVKRQFTPGIFKKIQTCPYECITNIPNSTYQTRLFFHGGKVWNRMNIFPPWYSILWSPEENFQTFCLNFRKHRRWRWILGGNFLAIVIGTSNDCVSTRHNVGTHHVDYRVFMFILLPGSNNTVCHSVKQSPFGMVLAYIIPCW